MKRQQSITGISKEEEEAARVAHGKIGGGLPKELDFPSELLRFFTLQVVFASDSPSIVNMVWFALWLRTCEVSSLDCCWRAPSLTAVDLVDQPSKYGKPVVREPVS